MSKLSLPSGDQPSDSPLPANSFLVGIGASAGGLQALTEFCQNLTAEPGACFVIVQHLSPDFRSLMVELLQRHTSLPVSIVEDGMALAVNQIYVLPPGLLVRLRGTHLFCEERPGNSTDYPIDVFFNSLAQERSDRTIGILLSGTGHDGTEGLKAISRSGGIALVQSMQTAQFGAMPNSPISSGLVDEILSPAELAQSVCDMIRYTASRAHLGNEGENLLSPDQLLRILTVLHHQENLDFSQYKPGTLHRRIVPRLLLSKSETVEDYITYLSKTPSESKALRQDLLIGATRFFRDSEMWSQLQTTVLPAIIQTLQPEQPLRLWVAACSTGEEAYTLAMAVDEVMEKLKRSNPVKLFATDVDAEALIIAAQGVYGSNMVRDLGEERLDRYFNLEGTNTYRIKKFIRSQIIFASHDLTQHPGFSQMHLVSCRNVLIYMQPPLQERVLNLLHFSLAPHGLLILGSAEHVGALDYAFQCTDQHWKFYRKRPDIKLPVSHLTRSPIIPSIPFNRPNQGGQSPYDRLLASILGLRFGENPTTCLLVNPTNQAIHVFLNTARLLEFPLGEINFNVLDIVLPSLKLPLGTALHRVREDNIPVLYKNVEVTEANPSYHIDLWVGPSGQNTAFDQPLIVLMEMAVSRSTTIGIQESEFNPDSAIAQHVRELEFELQQIRSNLQNSIEELEAANEEQQATNEELLAANEELQSTNEELQSVNEELYSVNTENQERIEQLIELTSDIDNLLRSTDIGVIFLDQDLNLRKFTPAAARVFNFRVGDMGRPLTELVNHLSITHLTTLIEQVAQTHESIDTEATNTITGDRLLLRVLPYRREDGAIDGVVLTLITINDLKDTQDALSQSNALLEDLYHNSPVGLCLLDRNLRFLKVNPTLAAMTGLTLAEHLGCRPQDIWSSISATISPYLGQVLSLGEAITNIEVTSTEPSSQAQRVWLTSYYPVTLADEQRGVGAIITDISEQKRIQRELEASQALVQQITESSPAILSLSAIDTGVTSYINRSVETILGYSPEEIYQGEGNFLVRLAYPDDRDRILAHLTTLAQSSPNQMLELEYRVRHKDRSWRWLYQRTTLFQQHPDQDHPQVLGLGTDITEQIKVRESLQQNELLLRTTLNHTPIILFTQDLDLHYTWVHHPFPGFSLEAMLGHSDQDLFPPNAASDFIAAKQRVLDSGETQTHEFVLNTPDYPCFFEFTLASQSNERGQIIGLAGVGIDITESRRNANQLLKITQRLEEAQRIAHLGDWEFDFSTNTTLWSPELFQITGFDPTLATPSVPDVLSIIHRDDLPLLLSLVNQRPQQQEAVDVDVRIYPQGSTSVRHVNILGKVIRNGIGNITKLYGTVMDITERQRNQENLQHQAFFDSLTGLPNRGFFLEHLKLARGRASRDLSYQFAVLYVDVDNFKAINDGHGHGMGDSLLIQIAQRLDRMMRPGDIVARIGGDEFAILLEQIYHPEMALEVACRLQSAIAAPLSLDNQPIQASLSIGIASYLSADGAQDDITLLENADIAMYQAKRRGTGNCELFHSSMRTANDNQAELKGGLLQALEQEEFELYYQPIIQIQQQTLMGFEVLVRWQHPQRGLLGAPSFLPIVTAAHLMPALESWILKQACHQWRQWSSEFKLDPNFRISINISLNLLKHSSFINNLRLALSHAGITKPHHICLELTEESLINYGDHVDTLLKTLKKLNISLALDDFGTGYSSLSYLHRLPLSHIKLDQGWVQELPNQPTHQNLTVGIISLARQLNLTVIAKGIETLEQLRLIQESGCDLGQGYYFYPPLSALDAKRLLRDPQAIAQKFLTPS
ncbi:EAL domain-containing protein [Prochlorothrix hollandica]|uniref:EAL domain-containing protein n=1 Tax=Prochlorothrix hollandica TaxID=1223 RepID=UPI0003458F59|nr:EAL domain-containing protein [Prochlorothrix hollandica]